MLEKVFEGGGIGEEVPGYGAELRLEDHYLSADGVRFFVCFLYHQVQLVVALCSNHEPGIVRFIGTPL